MPKSFSLYVQLYTALFYNLRTCSLPRLLITFTEDKDEPDWKGYFYATLLFVTAVVQSLFLHQYFHRCFTLGMRMRSAIVAAIYKKVGEKMADLRIILQEVPVFHTSEYKNFMIKFRVCTLSQVMFICKTLKFSYLKFQDCDPYTLGRVLAEG